MNCHTPGPWRVGSKEFDSTTVVGDHPGWECFTVANCGGSTSNSPKHKDLRQAQEANARLIAAVPRLLEALESMVQAQPCDCVVKGAGCPTCEALEVIAVARGEEVTR